MARMLVASLVIFGVLAGWTWVQAVYARFASRHPELGPFRSSDGGCGGCSCGSKGCERE